MLRRLLGREPEGWPVRYDRAQGPICLTTQLLYPSERLRKVTHTLLTSRIQWYWTSEREVEPTPAEGRAPLPSRRELTLLSTATEQAWLADCTERDVENGSRFILVLGFDEGLVVAQSSVRQQIEQFLAKEGGPLRVAISQLDDAQVDYVFVPHTPVDEVRRCLTEWGITPNGVRQTRPYRRLGTASLEAVVQRMLR